MGGGIDSSVIVAGCVVYRWKFVTVLCSALGGRTQRSPSGRRTKGQVQLPSLIHSYVKLTLCQTQMYEL